MRWSQVDGNFDQIGVGGIESPAMLRLSNMDHDDSRGRNKFFDNNLMLDKEMKVFEVQKVDLVTEMGNFKVCTEEDECQNRKTRRGSDWISYIYIL